MNATRNSNRDIPTYSNPLNSHFSWTDNKELAICVLCLPDKDCYLNLPTDMVEDNPLDMENIKEQ